MCHMAVDSAEPHQGPVYTGGALRRQQHSKTHVAMTFGAPRHGLVVQIRERCTQPEVLVPLPIHWGAKHTSIASKGTMAARHILLMFSRNVKTTSA